ncbi:hypothetical protein ACQPW3_14425 [Actinosynnema sp. CA-248983]
MTGAVPRPDGDPGPPPHIANHTGHVHGPSVQAGYVAGGIHFHAPPPPAPVPVRRVRGGRVFRAWLLFVVLVFVVAGFASYLLNVSVGHGSLTANLVADGVLLGVALGVLALRWRQVARDLSFRAYLGRVLARCVPRSVAGTSTPVLALVAAVLGVLLVTLFFTPMTAEYTAAQGRNGVLMFFLGLGVPVVRALVDRKRR